jgi:hypothetical protein
VCRERGGGDGPGSGGEQARDQREQDQGTAGDAPVPRRAAPVAAAVQ